MLGNEDSNLTTAACKPFNRLLHLIGCHAGSARTTCFGVLATTIGLWPLVVSAGDIPTGNEDLKVRWDNTLKYSAAYRLHNPSATLTSAAANSDNVNQDDGDRNFKRGLISNRVDLLSEFDLSYKQVGFRLSAAGWYDTVYHQHNDNPGFAGGAAPNQESVPYNEFTRATRKIHGGNAELLDAFVFGNVAVGETNASFRLGKHAITWGETLFFGVNGISGGMMPVDAVKLLSVPNTQFKEAIRPVPMLSGQWQLTPDTAIGSYYQFRWAKSRVPAVGSYFSPTDVLDAGAEQLLVAGPGSPYLNNAPRLSDQRPKNSGEGGFQLKTRAFDYDLGAYLIRYHDKTAQPVINVGPAAVVYVPGPGCVVPRSVQTGPSSCVYPGPVSYRLAYQEGITSFGLSASKTFGDVNFSTEASVRRNQPLNSGLTSDNSALSGAPASNNSNNPAYPTARTAHINISALWSVMPNVFARESSVAAEVGWNHIMSFQHHPELFDPNATRSAIAVRGVYSATYRQVASGLDLAPQLGLGWAPHGSRSSITTTTMPQNGNGDVTLGFEATYLDVWRTDLAVTHYYGSAGGALVPGATPGSSSFGFKNYSADRDFVAFSLRRSF